MDKFILLKVVCPVNGEAGHAINSVFNIDSIMRFIPDEEDPTKSIIVTNLPDEMRTLKVDISFDDLCKKLSINSLDDDYFSSNTASVSYKSKNEAALLVIKDAKDLIEKYKSISQAVHVPIQQALIGKIRAIKLDVENLEIEEDGSGCIYLWINKLHLEKYIESNSHYISQKEESEKTNYVLNHIMTALNRL